METLKDLLYGIGSFFADKIRVAADWFMELNIFNKIIVVNTLTSFFAITLPIAKYYIFETWFFINNPVAVYLIFITVIMLVTVFFHGQLVLGVRVILNLWYFLYVIYMTAFHTISKAPYVLSKGFVFNLLAPVVYLAVSVLLYMSGDEY
ncbi:MAG: hypothetical protein FWF73_01840 [Spirochaetes bacterium]|nr:hypothetical protein [Spirochaetota bacterium]